MEALGCFIIKNSGISMHVIWFFRRLFVFIIEYTPYDSSISPKSPMESLKMENFFACWKVVHFLKFQFFNSQGSNRKQISGQNFHIWHQTSSQVIRLRSFIPVWSGLGRFYQAYSCFGTKTQIFYKYLMGLIHNNRTEILQKF